jgi:hypothetical protein
MQTNFGYEPMRVRMPRGRASRKNPKLDNCRYPSRIDVPKPDNLYYMPREAVCEAQKPRKRADWRKFWDMLIGGAGLALGVFSMMVILYYLFGGVIR